LITTVTENGIIPESVKVWKISASDTSEDYHKNINEAEFNKWMASLEAVLKKMGGNWIIIIVFVLDKQHGM